MMNTQSGRSNLLRRRIPHCIVVLCSLGLCVQSCTKEHTPDTNTPKNISTETRCFLLAEHGDTTRVSLTMKGDTAYGTMDWQPYQQDGAHGTLGGKKNDLGEWDLMYHYTIEGAEQSETKTMMIRGDALLIKSGELVDPAGNGNLCYKDAATARYSDTLHAVPCN